MSENNRTIPSGGYYICNYKQDRLGKITNISSSNDVLEVDKLDEPLWDDVLDSNLLYDEDNDKYYELEVKTNNNIKSIVISPLPEAVLKFNKNNNQIEPFSVILCNRGQDFLGQIANISNLNFKGNLNAADELTFEVNKTVNGYNEPLWDDIFDLRLVFVKEINEYFEITVSYTDQTQLTKTVTATSLCEAELSQTMLYDIEINTETDILAHNETNGYPNWTGSTFWTTVSGAQYEKDTILYRVLEKVPAYSIAHVDESLCNLQRVFTINGTSVYDWLVGDCAKEFNCLVKFDSRNRSISFYDLYTVCPKCHSRGLYNDKCTHIITDDDIKKYGINGLINGKSAGYECGNTDLKYYGEDTSILVSTENLTDEIKYETDIGAVKNSFRLVAGDDDMTAAVININPNGSQYIYHFSPETLKDMPDELTDALDEYNVLYEEYRYRKLFTLSNPNPESYNNLVNKYNATNRYPESHDNERLSIIPSTVRGYVEIMKYIYQAMDFYSYLESSMMPYVSISDVNVNTEAAKLEDLTGPIALSSLSERTTIETVNSAVLNYAKVFVKIGYINIEIDNSSTSYGYDSTSEVYRWSGRFILTDNSVSDENDALKTKTTRIFNFIINDEYDVFMRQKIAKKIVKETDDTYDVLTLSNLTQFENKITFYSLNRLQAFKDSIDAVLSILQEAGQGNAVKETDEYGVEHIISKPELYDQFYVPYYNKYKLVEAEYNRRSLELHVIAEYQNDYMVSGILYRLLNIRDEVHDILDFRKYLDVRSEGTRYDLYKLLTTYVRQDEYNNSNYISVDLDNEKLFKMAEMFYEAAEEELLKSSTYQHSLSANLYNLLAMDEFKPITNKFKLGNWLRVKTDDILYRLRLISYSINFEDPTTLNTEFSDVTVTGMGYNDLSSILDQSKSMATSYPAITRQAELGEMAKSNINEWVERGLNSAKTRIMNNNDEEIGITEAGITAKTINDITGDYDSEQLRITHNVLAFTDDNWETVKTALGKFTLTHHLVKDSDTREVQEEKYGLVAEAVLAGWVVGSHIEGGDIIAPYIQNVGNSTYINLGDDSVDHFISVDNGRFVIDKEGNFFSVGGHIGWREAGSNNDTYAYIDINGNINQYPYFIHLMSDSGAKFSVSKADASITSSGGHFQNISDSSYIDLGGTNNYYFLKCGDTFSVTKDGYLKSTSGTIGGFYIGENFLTTGIDENWDIQHGKNDITITTSNSNKEPRTFSTTVDTFEYNSTLNEVVELDDYVVSNSKFAIGNDFCVSDKGEFFCKINKAGNIVTQSIRANLIDVYKEFNVGDQLNWTTIKDGTVETQWIYSLGATLNPATDVTDGSVLGVECAAFHQDGQVSTVIDGTTYYLPWMTMSATPGAPASLPPNCIYLVYEDTTSSGTSPSISGDVTQDIIPSV